MIPKPASPRGRLHSRRTFATTAAASAFSFMVVPRHVLGGPAHTAPSDRVDFAGIGAGGMGGDDIRQVAKLGANVVALCDVDDVNAARNYEMFPQARRYKDFRKMLDREQHHIDAVTVGTPDHLHAVASMAAMQRGKHVYCEKPLSHTVYEARQLTRAARKYGVATQMGNQGHASEGPRLAIEWIRAGVIGEVREVHCWTDRPGKYWKQGIRRPPETPPTPATLDWDLWLGPAPRRPYHPAYAPFHWRGWWDFGTGALGDMGCHIIDHPVWALQLGSPTAIEAIATSEGSELDGAPNRETYPLAALVYYEFAARGNLPPVKLTWYDGGLMPPTPAEMPPGQKLPANGILYIGSHGKMYQDREDRVPHLLPEGLNETARRVEKTMPRSPGHRQEWLLACRGQGTAMSNFNYSGPLTETVLLGVLAQRAPGNRLEWDSKNLKVKNMPELDSFVHKEYRRGWTLS